MNLRVVSVLVPKLRERFTPQRHEGTKDHEDMLAINYLDAVFVRSLMKKELTDRSDVELLVTEFYKKVRKDEKLAPVFAHVDWEHHTPIIINFWSSILLGDQSYQGNPFHKHVNLPIKQQHFAKWLELFKQTLQENFEGEKANEAMDRANSIAKMFQFRLGLI